MTADDQRVTQFRALHEAGCFVMPNPWDAGSARVLEHLGARALATTSAGFAWTRGQADTRAPLGAVLEHLRAVVDAVSVPVNADFEGGYAVEPEEVGANVARAVRTGVAGLSIEDSSGRADEPLLDLDLAVARIAAARAAIDESGTGVVLTGRSEGFVVGRPDIEETVKRLRAYADAGADCLYAPRIDRLEHVRAVVEAVKPLPVNLLINAPFITVAEAAGLGVRRVSVGGTLARAAWGGWLDTAREILQEGTFSGFSALPDVNGLMAGLEAAPGGDG